MPPSGTFNYLAVVPANFLEDRSSPLARVCIPLDGVVPFGKNSATPHPIPHSLLTLARPPPWAWATTGSARAR
jgi:hypothetical protein